MKLAPTNLKSPANALGQRSRRYVIVGLGLNGTLYILFLGLIWLGIPPVVASAAGYVIGVASSYLINRAWSFSSDQSHSRDAPKFLAAYGVGLVVTMLTVAMLDDPLGPALAQICAIILAPMAIYSVLELLRFGR